MDNPEIQQHWTLKDTGQINVRENRRRTIANGQSRDTSILDTEDTGHINVRENRRDNREWKIQRYINIGHKDTGQINLYCLLDVEHQSTINTCS
jgi:hypothetical protein